MCGKYFVFIIFFRGEHPEIGACGIGIFCDKAFEDTEHGAIFHIMAVDDGVQVLEVPVISIVNKNSSSKIISFLVGHMEIIIIICSLYHRITDSQSLHIQPSHYVLIFSQQGIEIYGDGGLRTVITCLGAFRIGVHGQLFQFFVLIFCLFIVHINAVKFPACKSKHPNGSQQGQCQQVVACLFLLFFIFCHRTPFFTVSKCKFINCSVEFS